MSVWGEGAGGAGESPRGKAGLNGGKSDRAKNADLGNSHEKDQAKL